MDLSNVSPSTMRRMSDRRFRELMRCLIDVQQKDRKENALLYYKPVSEHAEQIHLFPHRYIGVGGGNGSSKTEGCLAELSTCSTGVVPDSLRDKIDINAKLRGPINCRVVCESLTTVLYPIILPKLQWFKWTGIDAPGGERGHWGWIPRNCLIGGSWQRSWSDKLRILRVLYRDPRDPMRVIGESTIQFCSVDQDPSDFASGDFHLIIHDEPPPLPIWRENEARTMRVNGRMMLAMTWPDDPAIPVDWIFDEMHEPGSSKEDNGKVWLNLFTTDNPYLDQSAVSSQMKTWTPEMCDVRIYGRPIRFSNRVHKEFTDQTLWWCFGCKGPAVVTNGRCERCGSHETVSYNHVHGFEPNPNWPTVWLLDPHPRKPHMFMWVQIDPQDDLWEVAEGEVEGDPVDVKLACDEVERELSLHVTQRIVDPNMARSPASARRGVTWQDEFDKVDLRCDLADDSDPGRQRFNDYLRPDPHTYSPRIHIHPSCTKTIQQIKRYVWDDYKKSADKGQKQKPKDKNDDYPTLWKYLMNTDPSFRRIYMMQNYIRDRAMQQRRRDVREPGAAHGFSWR